MLSGITLALFISEAEAGKCDALLRKAQSASKGTVAAAYMALAMCDGELAENTFPTVVTKASDVDTLVDLSLAAIETDGWNAVWATIGKISDYETRDLVAAGIGEHCADSEKVVQFLQGAYFGLKDIEFKQWDDAYMTCDSDKLVGWLAKHVEDPPKSSFDEKYNTLLEVFADKQEARALPSLTKAALAAAKEGPYDAILIQMDAAVAPSLGEDMPADDKQALEDALIDVAKGVAPEKAKSVANRLHNAGSTKAALDLRKTIFMDRMNNGNFTYGAVSIEAGECKGEKTAVVHYAEVTEPGSRWNILDDVQAAMREYKPRLHKKCEPEGEWPVIVSPEPLDGTKGLSEWVHELESGWKEKGYETSTRSESGITLQ